MSEDLMAKLRVSLEKARDRRPGIEPCSTPECPGDGRYAAPGRGHLDACRFPWSPESTE